MADWDSGCYHTFEKDYVARQLRLFYRLYEEVNHHFGIVRPHTLTDFSCVTGSGLQGLQACVLVTVDENRTC